MRGVVFTGGRELEMMEFPDPTPGPDEVVVEMKASGMCGSDLHQYRRPEGTDAPGDRLSAEPQPGDRRPRTVRRGGCGRARASPTRRRRSARA